MEAVIVKFKLTRQVRKSFIYYNADEETIYEMICRSEFGQVTQTLIGEIKLLESIGKIELVELDLEGKLLTPDKIIKILNGEISLKRKSIKVKQSKGKVARQLTTEGRQADDSI